MSFTFWKPTPYGHRQKENNWINEIIHFHDNFCGCDEPIKHLIWKLAHNAPQLNIEKEDLQKLQKCLPTTTTDGTTGEDQHTDAADGDADNIDEGDLDRLFEEDFGDDTR
ncbi:hypothetical protein TTMV3_gp1 [Torque teno mini virus 3]|uniref:Hepatitis TT virus Orf2/Gyrovirus Vp2 N-terminal domain-containing protein n=1 Tax=Torque teno mini virus 3 TaxID=687371 RepID=Q9JG51_9VIRU|nr:hypothetical protein TTMV3_gp1 [Torque teno mini virus 3]BAA93608.1 unnamed protein product [Torque teno mini virus 3]